jgi:sporulation protein YlmC with PRC-barrel domain
MYVTELRGLRIFSLMSALKMGTVEDVLLEPGCRFVAALCVREYGPGSRRFVLRKSVKRVGRNAVILGGTDEMPEESSIENADRLINLRTLLGLEVVSDHGNLVGRVRNAVIDPETLAIEVYEIAHSPMDRLMHRELTQQVDAHDTLSASKDVIIVPEEAVTGERTAPEERQGAEEMAAPARWVAPDVLEGQDEAGAGAAMG